MWYKSMREQCEWVFRLHSRQNLQNRSRCCTFVCGRYLLVQAKSFAHGTSGSASSPRPGWLWRYPETYQNVCGSDRRPDVSMASLRKFMQPILKCFIMAVIKNNSIGLTNTILQWLYKSPRRSRHVVTCSFFYGTRRSITVFTKARHRFLSWGR